MSHSLLSASPQIRVKIVILALVGAILIVLGSITAHVKANHDLARVQTHMPVVKAAKPMTYSERDKTVIR
jgi:hypothetical protein